MKYILVHGLGQNGQSWEQTNKWQADLCGLSLGGVLALDFAKEYPEKVNSIILIGVPYKIPKVLFGLQGILFHFMPRSVFEKRCVLG